MELKKKIAVITNSSIMGKEHVRVDLYMADIVSVKVDALSEKIWKKINRPKKP